MGDAVKRWDAGFFSDKVKLHESGDYILHSDYEALARRAQALEAVVQEYRNGHSTHGRLCEKEAITFSDRMNITDTRCKACKQADPLLSVDAATAMQAEERAAR